MLPIARPSTPRTDIYHAITRSNQITLYPNMKAVINQYPELNLALEDKVREAKEKFPNLDAKIKELTDHYIPATLAENHLYNADGQQLSLQTNYNEGFMRENFETHEFYSYEYVDDAYDSFEREGIGDIQADPIMDNIETILTQKEHYNTFREWQNSALEVFTIEGMTGRERSLNGQEGVRPKQFIPKHTLLDIWGGIHLSGTPQIFAIKRALSKDPKKYHFSAMLYPDKNVIDGQSIAKKMNSSQRLPEKENVIVARIPYKTSENKDIFIPALLAKHDISAGEELRYNYSIF